VQRLAVVAGACPMSKRRTVIDANLWIAACSGRGELFKEALTILEDPDRQLMDAVHLAEARADEFVSGEKPGKPMFRVQELLACCLWGESAV